MIAEYRSPPDYAHQATLPIKERANSWGKASVITPMSRGCLITRPGLLGTPGLVRPSSGMRAPIPALPTRHDLQNRLRPDRNLTDELPVMRGDQQHRRGYAGRERLPVIAHVFGGLFRLIGARIVPFA